MHRDEKMDACYSLGMRLYHDLGRLPLSGAELLTATSSTERVAVKCDMCGVCDAHENHIITWRDPWVKPWRVRMLIVCSSCLDEQIAACALATEEYADAYTALHLVWANPGSALGRIPRELMRYLTRDILPSVMRNTPQ
jgi:hypothetical protein